MIAIYWLRTKDCLGSRQNIFHPKKTATTFIYFFLCVCFLLLILNGLSHALGLSTRWITISIQLPSPYQSVVIVLRFSFSLEMSDEHVSLLFECNEITPFRESYQDTHTTNLQISLYIIIIHHWAQYINDQTLISRRIIHYLFGYQPKYFVFNSSENVSYSKVELDRFRFVIQFETFADENQHWQMANIGAI